MASVNGKKSKLDAMQGLIQSGRLVEAVGIQREREMSRLKKQHGVLPNPLAHSAKKIGLNGPPWGAS